MDTNFCSICNINILKKNYSRHLRSLQHLKNLQESHIQVVPTIPTEPPIKKTNKRIFEDSFENNDYIIKKSEEALEGCFLTFRVEIKQDINNYEIIKNDLADILYEKFKLILSEKQGIKLQIYSMGLFYNRLSDENREIGITSKNIIILNKKDIKKSIINLIEKIEDKIDSWENNEAYWLLKRILLIDFKLREYKTLAGSSYIPTPDWISKTKSIINIKNEDNKCFKYCILYGLYNNEINNHPERINHYKNLENNQNKLNFNNIQFPVKIDDIKRFCNQNNQISINVYYINDNNKNIFPYLTYAQNEKRQYHINLLLLQDNEKTHYVIIKNLGKLVSHQINKDGHKKFICERCFHCTSSSQLLIQHYEFCDYYQKYEKAIPILPKENKNILKFKNIKNTVNVPLVYYTDFESIIRKDTLKHELCSYSFFALGKDEFYKNFQIHTGKSANDTINNYVNKLKSEAINLDKELKNRLNQFKSHNLTEDEEIKYQNEKKCHFCKIEFDEKDIKVRDHCHITGKFRGAAHQTCNLNVRTSLNVKIIFHNGSNYDFKFIIRKLYKISNDLKVIPFTDEKYLSFSIKIPETNIIFTFIDSYRFLEGSLEVLTKILNEKEGELEDKFPYTKQFFNENYPNIKDEDFKYIIQKGVFPYEYLDSFDKLNDKNLPDIKEFYSSIKDKNITLEDYNRAIKVFNLLKCKNLKDYLEDYLSIDVFLLCDIFEEFRKTSKKYYNLDPAHYYSTPGLSQDSMLKLTNIELELLTDIDMLYFFQEAIIGGLSFISKRYVKVNNKYMKDFDNTQDSSYFIPLDANNLYGNAMSQYLPYKDFKWCTDEEIEDLEKELFNIPDNSDIGYTLQVDLEYPKDLHDKHNDFPFFPEHLTVNYEMLSDYQKKLITNINIYKSSKLIANLNNKNKIILDYRCLKQGIKHGLILKKIYKVIKYKQSPWLKIYIDKNTNLRINSRSEFEKNFFKLMNNSIYGKTIENVMKRQNIKFITEKKKALKYISKINFKRETIFTKNLVAIHMNKERILFNKPIYLGFTILQMSKFIMYEFAYEYIKPKWNDKVIICGGDTDSLFLEIKTEDFYKDICLDIEKWFDTSNFEENNNYHIKRVNGKVLGKFKIESGDNIPIEFVGLRSKTYNIKLENELNKVAQKGTPKHKINKDIDLYKEVLFKEKQSYIEYNRIGSKKLNIYTLHEKKVALTNFDDKRYILNDGITTLAYGHFGIKEIENLKFNDN